MSLRVHLSRSDGKALPPVALWYSSAKERNANAVCLPDAHFDFMTSKDHGAEGVLWNGYDPQNGKGPYAVFVLDSEYPSDVVSGVGWVWGTEHEKPELWFELQEVGSENGNDGNHDRMYKVHIEGDLTIRIG